jgi:hypothetical protein
MPFYNYMCGMEWPGMYAWWGIRSGDARYSSVMHSK